MPLPPAPTHRASRLTHKAFETSDTSTDAPVMVQNESKRGLSSETPVTSSAKRPARSRKNEARPLTPKTPVVAQATPVITPQSMPQAAPTPGDAPPAHRASKPAPTRSKRRSGPSKLFVLDTNVLMHDPMSLFRFEEHDVFLPMIVLEELDGHKKGMTEVARNARQASRSLDTLASAQGADLGKGSPLNATGHTDAMGQLFFQTQALDLSLPLALPQGKADNQILGVVKALSQLHAPRDVVLVSKDINMRVKARALGLQAEDYQNDKTLEDGDLLYPGSMALPPDFWLKNGKTVESWQQGTQTFYRISGPIVPSLFINQFVYFEAPGEPSLHARVTEIRGKTAVLRTLKDFNHQKNAVWGVTTRNREQSFAMNLLTDPDVDFVTLAGTAGTGKTLMALAAGLTQVLDDRRYTEIIMTRATVSVGEDIGFLPGTEEEKMGPWMGALDDNLEFLAKGDGGNAGEWGRAATNELIKSRIKDQEHELHARSHLHEQVRDHRRSPKPDAQADENADHARGPGDQDHLHGQPGPDRHALPDRRLVGPDLRSRPFQGLGTRGAHHAGSG
jgi:PhoH-like ATPase